VVAEGVYEQLVETYLCLDRSLFVNSQYLVGEHKIWEAYPDFLAIDFLKSQIWMVEVSKAPQGKMFEKIRHFETDYVHRIARQLAVHRVIRDDLSEWQVGFWAFVPKAEEAATRSRFVTANVPHYEVTPLEEIFFPSWDKRFR
jgi:hypothetical protein